MNTNFSLKPGSTSKIILSCLRSWATAQEIIIITGLNQKIVRAKITYYGKIGMVEKTGIKPYYLYRLK